MVVRRLLHESPPLVRLALTTVRLRAADVKIIRGASPLGLPDCLSRSPLRRLAPIGRLASLRSLAGGGNENRPARFAALARGRWQRESAGSLRCARARAVATRIGRLASLRSRAGGGNENRPARFAALARGCRS